ncbi:hypothetical protein [Thalassolituus sp. UBA2009]|uniref:hypothetical protein n=1 Tax=Thalassolituus sp. UBA2009 TaxID=1947658 RepID=UPI0025798DAC|nr:hypothetical protein [Thalassolituus sp. UBA2009]
MLDGFSTTYVKAIDDLALKVCIPGLICSIFVEVGPWYFSGESAGIFKIYFFSLAIAMIVLTLGFFAYIEVSIRLFDGHNIAPFIGVAIMPLGFAGFFPEYFKPFEIPYTKVTGFAILAWSLLLVKDMSHANNDS